MARKCFNVDLIDKIDEWYEVVCKVIGEDIIEVIYKYHSNKTKSA